MFATSLNASPPIARERPWWSACDGVQMVSNAALLISFIPMGNAVGSNKLHE